MATSATGFSGGIQLPVQAGQNGGFRLLEGDEYIAQLIGTLVSDLSCENPFYQAGLGLEAIFANVSEGGWRAVQLRKIVDVFKDLERGKIAKLVDTTWSRGPGEGEFSIGIRYLSIETNTEQEVKTVVRRR